MTKSAPQIRKLLETFTANTQALNRGFAAVAQAIRKFELEAHTQRMLREVKRQMYRQTERKL